MVGHFSFLTHGIHAQVLQLKKYTKPDQHFGDVSEEMCKSQQTSHANTVVMHCYGATDCVRLNNFRTIRSLNKTWCVCLF